jgi:hypothetical protein
MIKDLLESPTGQIIISVILGLGLATLFRKVCTSNNCIVIKGPNLKDLEKYYYKVDGDCYKYTPYVTNCSHETNAESKR